MIDKKVLLGSSRTLGYVLVITASVYRLLHANSNRVCLSVDELIFGLIVIRPFEGILDEQTLNMLWVGLVSVASVWVAIAHRRSTLWVIMLIQIAISIPFIVTGKFVPEITLWQCMCGW